jgi:hypothetical protein
VHGESLSKISHYLYNSKVFFKPAFTSTVPSSVCPPPSFKEQTKDQEDSLLSYGQQQQFGKWKSSKSSAQSAISNKWGRKGLQIYYKSDKNAGNPLMKLI